MIAEKERTFWTEKWRVFRGWILTGSGELRYIGGNDDLPAPLETEEETESISEAETEEILSALTYEGRDYTATCEVTVEEPSYCTPVYSQTSNNYGILLSEEFC